MCRDVELGRGESIRSAVPQSRLRALTRMDSTRGERWKPWDRVTSHCLTP